MNNFLEKHKESVSFLVINAIYTYFLILHFHEVRKNKEIICYDHQIEKFPLY